MSEHTVLVDTVHTRCLGDGNTDRSTMQKRSAAAVGSSNERNDIHTYPCRDNGHERHGASVTR